MKLYGLTGGIGSGKSTVSTILRALGFEVICLDTLNKEAAKNPEVRDRILERFGTMDRNELRAIVFGDPQAKSDMEQLMHGYVHDLYKQRITELEAKGTKCVFYDSAIIFELRQSQMFDKIIVVDCPDFIRIDRATKRDSSNAEMIKKIVAFQVSDRFRRKFADYLIDNSGEEGKLGGKVLDMLYGLGEL